MNYFRYQGEANQNEDILGYWGQLLFKFNDTLSRRPGLHEEDEPVDMDRFCALDEISNLVDDHLKRKE